MMREAVSPSPWPVLRGFARMAFLDLLAYRLRYVVGVLPPIHILMAFGRYQSPGS